MRSLTEQVKRDFADLTMLLERLRSGKLNISEIEQINQKISWIKESLKMLNKFKMINIEGVLWGKIHKIQDDVERIESVFIKEIFPMQRNGFSFVNKDTF
jgi:hypothetical protein